MSAAAVLPMASAAGITQFERERLARIAMIQAEMHKIMQGVDTSLLVKQPRAPKPKAPGAMKRKAAAAADGEVRRSSRIHNLPVPLYCIAEDSTDGCSSSRRHSTTPGSKGLNGRRCHGAAAAALFGAEADPYMQPPLGWKPECGSASLAAAEAATDAALALARQLNAQGTPAVVKLMSASQVSGGFWCQLPIDIGPHYGTDKQQHKRTLTLHCFDKAEQSPELFINAHPGSSTKWSVVHLPKGEGACCGLSGGWRGFAIDQRIFPNDTVVFACIDQEPAAPAAAAPAAAAAASAATDAEDAGKQSSSPEETAEGITAERITAERSDSAECPELLQQQQQQQQQQHVVQDSSAAAAAAAARVKPRDRMHMQAYIFGANDYEAEASSKQQQLQLPPTPQQAGDAAAPGRMGSLTPRASSQQQQQFDEQSSGAAAAAAEGSPESDVEDALADVPLAKRAKLAAQQQQQGSSAMSRAVVCAASGCSALSGLQLPLSPQQHAVQQLGLMEAAEAGLLQVKVARQGSSSIGTASTPPAAAAAAQPLQKSAAANAPRQKRAAAAAASKAWGGGQHTAKGSSSSGSSSSKAKAHAASGGVKLVPKPADPTQLVPAPSKAEAATAHSCASYEVEQILAHRVNAATGADEFLISWRGYGPYWDTWEGADCLDGAPGRYPWQGGKAAIPRKFRL